MRIVVHPKRFTIMWGGGGGGGWGGVGGLLNHHQCTASTWTMPRLPQDNGASALTTHQLQVERESLSQLSGCAHHTPATGGERVIEPIKWMGIIKRPWLIRASGGNWPGHWDYTPTLYEKCHGIINDHRESGPWFNVSSERRCFLTVLCPRHFTGALGPTQGLTNTSSSSNIVFLGGLPSRYWPGSTLLSFSGKPVLGCRGMAADHIFLYFWKKSKSQIKIVLKYGENRNTEIYNDISLLWSKITHIVI